MAAGQVKILCDSCCDLPAALLAERGITSIPLTVNFGEQSMRDGVDVSSDQFYERLKSSPVMPTTSQIPPVEYMTRFKELTADGSEVVYVGLSSGLSGSAQNAVMAATADPTWQGQVHVVDSLGASVGLGLMVLRASDLAQAGKSGAEIAADLNSFRSRVCHVFTLDTLEYARRSGRVSNFSAILANVLDVKPVLHMDMLGKLVAHEKVRGRKKALNRLFDEVDRMEISLTGRRVGISHAAAEEDARAMADRFRTQYGAGEVVIGQIGATIGAHVGPGCVSIFFEGPEGRGC